MIYDIFLLDEQYHYYHHDAAAGRQSIKCNKITGMHALHSVVLYRYNKYLAS